MRKQGGIAVNTFQLRCFLSVAQHLNFARAAQALIITQPAVTHQIRSLETELNVKLFRRTTRTVELTPAGYLFLTDAKSMVSIAERAVKRFEDPNAQLVETLSIGCCNYAHLFMLAAALRRMKELHPNLHPQLQVVPYQQLHRLLQEEAVDAVLGFQEMTGGKTEGVYRELRRIPAVCICQSDSPLSRKKKIRAEDLTEEKLVLTDPAVSPAGIVQLQGSLMGVRPRSDFHFCESVEAAAVLVQAGFGAAIIPDWGIPSFLPLVRIPIEGFQALSFGIYYKTLEGNAPLRTFIRLMQEEPKRREKESRPG